MPLKYCRRGVVRVIFDMADGSRECKTYGLWGSNRTIGQLDAGIWSHWTAIEKIWFYTSPLSGQESEEWTAFQSNRYPSDKDYPDPPASDIDRLNANTRLATRDAAPRLIATSQSDRFPGYYPSTRNFTFSDWNNKRFSGANSGQVLTISLPSAAVDSNCKLSLTFANRSDAVANAVLNHYHVTMGSLKGFKLSSEILSDWDSSHRSALQDATWIYEAPPQVTTSHLGTSTTSVRLCLVK